MVTVENDIKNRVIDAYRILLQNEAIAIAKADALAEINKGKKRTQQKIKLGPKEDKQIQDICKQKNYSTEAANTIQLFIDSEINNYLNDISSKYYDGIEKYVFEILLPKFSNNFWKRGFALAFKRVFTAIFIIFISLLCIIILLIVILGKDTVINFIKQILLKLAN